MSVRNIVGPPFRALPPVQLDDLPHRRLRIGQRQGALFGLQLPMRNHQESQRGAVEERHLRQIDDDVFHGIDADGLQHFLKRFPLGIGKVAFQF